MLKIEDLDFEELQRITKFGNYDRCHIDLAKYLFKKFFLPSDYIKSTGREYVYAFPTDEERDEFITNKEEDAFIEKVIKVLKELNDKA